ncbi:uncharacterized protein LOC110715214 [Chenopodium quinoa]|uniref:uncharacterized protein LOC110715214 n=1 Tax=Chenopodium quinoa TaxID=63459 RepID=UPI000B7893E0|nr:uncharacterized protein LOC110715214 [Chenopodium quinoa]
MNKMPPKLKEPGNFSIPCAINKMQIDNALCALGASVSLMPYSIYQRLELGELMPSKITLQLVNRSNKIPKGKVEDAPLRVGKSVILVDFVVLKMDEDAKIPIIRGRPFLATLGALIDVKSAKISLKHLLTSIDPIENVLLNKYKIGALIKEMAIYEDLLNGSIEEMDDHICMNISSQEALQVTIRRNVKVYLW